MFLDSVFLTYAVLFIAIAFLQFIVPIKEIMTLYPAVKLLGIAGSITILLGISLAGYFNYFHLTRDGFLGKEQPLIMACAAGFIAILVTYFRIHHYRKKMTSPT